MITKTHLTVAEVADIMGIGHRAAWRRLRKVGALVALPGYKLRCHVPVKRLADLLPDEYERVMIDARFWDGECIHPSKSRRTINSGVWCECCGSVRDGDGWHRASTHKKDAT